MGVQLQRRGANPLLVMGLISAVILVGIGLILFRRPSNSAGDTRLFVYCAAGMRVPMTRIANEYEKEFGVKVELQYGGSNTLLNQIQVARIGDIYLAADDSYTNLAAEKGLVKEQISIASMRPVIAVAKGNPKGIKSIKDLLRKDVIVALGNPKQAAIGKKTRKLLTKSGHWKDVEEHVRKAGVFKPTVPDIALDVKGGHADAAIVWDAIAIQMGLTPVRTPELDKGQADITIGILSDSEQATEALRFARYAAARDKGLMTFKELGYSVGDGDIWGGRQPEVTFFAGSVNRRALEPILAAFAEREGVKINTIYNGCGILTGQMRTMQSKKQSNGFPDVFMACDVYYLETVADLFQDAVNVSDADMVIAVQAGNPKGIKTLQDLVKPGIRVAVGHPKQCTIGVLTKRLFENAGIYDKLMKNNVVTQTTSSANLIATLENVDAAIVYVTDTQERVKAGKMQVVTIDSPLAKAVQPYSIARSSDFKHLGRRLFDRVARSREVFEKAGFQWRLSGASANPGSTGKRKKSDDGKKTNQPKKPKSADKADGKTKTP